MKRNETDSLRKPEATSIGRALGFNRVYIGRFFANLKAVLVKHTFGPEQTYKLNKSGISTVHTPNDMSINYRDYGGTFLLYPIYCWH